MRRRPPRPFDRFGDIVSGRCRPLSERFFSPRPAKRTLRGRGKSGGLAKGNLRVANFSCPEYDFPPPALTAKFTLLKMRTSDSHPTKTNEYKHIAPEIFTAVTEASVVQVKATLSDTGSISGNDISDGWRPDFQFLDLADDLGWCARSLDAECDGTNSAVWSAARTPMHFHEHSLLEVVKWSLTLPAKANSSPPRCRDGCCDGRGNRGRRFLTVCGLGERRAAGFAGRVRGV